MTLPGPVTRIRAHAFAKMSFLRSIILNDGLTVVEDQAFKNSTLQEISISATVSEIGNQAFYGCKALKTCYVRGDCSVNVGEHVKSSVVVLPSRGTLCGNQFLWDLRALREVALPNGVERIGCYWFVNSGIENVTISVSVREIGDEAFLKCRKLR